MLGLTCPLRGCSYSIISWIKKINYWIGLCAYLDLVSLAAWKQVMTCIMCAVHGTSQWQGRKKMFSGGEADVYVLIRALARGKIFS